MGLAISKKVLALAVALVLPVGLAACGSDGKTDTSSGGSTTTTTAAANTNADAGAAAAQKAIAPYVGQPSAFPVTEQLKKIPKGAKIAYMDCGNPVCGLFWDLLQPAAKTMGVELTRVKTGSAANTVADAFDSVVAQKPDAVIVVATNIELWKSQLKQLQDAGTKVVTTGVTGVQDLVKAPQAAEPSNVLGGELLANYVAANMGPNANVVLYNVPELPFTADIGKTFKTTLEKNCPACKLRFSSVPITQLGNTAPNTVVSDLQSHPDTDVAVFVTDEIEIGLPTATKAAGINVKTLGYGPVPANLEYIKAGQETASLGYDLPVATWTLLDLAARQIVGQELSGPAAKGFAVNQFLTKEDITFDPSKGWTGYPDFAQRFSKLWGVQG